MEQVILILILIVVLVAIGASARWRPRQIVQTADCDATTDALIEVVAQQNRLVPRESKDSQALLESLLVFFEHSLCSRQILKAVVTHEERFLPKSELMGIVNEALKRKGKIPLSERSLEQVIQLLVGAHLISISAVGDHSPTEEGKLLYSLILRRRSAGR